MDALTENDILFSNVENNGTVFTHNEEVPQLSVEEMIEKGSKILTRCLNIIRNLENLRADSAFDEVCKILFIKILEDRKEIRVLNYWDIDTEDIAQAIFNDAKKSNDYNVFDKAVTINIKVKTFNHVLSELMNLNWVNDISDKARGQLFDNLLNGLSRNNMGEMFTPPTIVKYMIDILDPKKDDMICSPFCGNGSFLIGAYQHIQLAKHIYGVDIYENAIKNAKIKAFMYRIEGINLFNQNILIDSDEIKENQFDIIFTQPPFGLKSYNPNNVFNEKHKIYRAHKQLDFIFIQRCLDLLKDGGRMGIIVREGVLFEGRLKNTRNYIQNQAKILQITSLPAGVFSPFTGIKTSIIFLQKLTSEEKQSLILFADVKEVGITLKGNKSTNNELILLAKEYKNVLADNKISNQTLLKEAQFDAQASNWHIGYLTNVDIERNVKYNYQKLSSFLIKNTNTIIISDSEEYQRVKVKYNNKVILRDKIKGIDIGTKKQFRIAKGQLIVAKIGANNGALGIVPDELDNAIVTSDFSTYTIDKSILPAYLVLLLSNKRFTNYFSESTTGSVMRRLNEDLFLNIEIPVPSLSEQIELSKKIIDLNEQIKSLTKELIKEEIVFENTLFEN